MGYDSKKQTVEQPKGVEKALYACETTYRMVRNSLNLGLLQPKYLVLPK